jgi:cytochrome c-type biogenesis protein CcsB
MKHNILNLVLLLSCLNIGSVVWANDKWTAPLGQIAVQEGGRIKPLDTVAREALDLIYGKQKYEGRPALEIVMTILLQPQAWEQKALFEIRHLETKQALKLDAATRYFTLKQISESDRLSTLMQDLQSQREAKEKLNPYYQALQRVESQIMMFRHISSGEIFRFVPQADGQKSWLALPQFPEQGQTQFQSVIQYFVAILGVVSSTELSDADKKEQAVQYSKQLHSSVQEFIAFARAQNPEVYPSANKIAAEVHYSHFHPFKYAWIFYLLGALAVMLSWITSKNLFYRASWVFTVFGFALHCYGFALRVYLTERPPVTNMYETVIWVGWGTLVFAAIFEIIYRWRFLLFSGLLITSFCLILGDLAPAVLDASLQPLEPVLRSNFWLLVHVLVITISYAAFFLAMGLSDLGLFYVLKGEEKNKEKIKAIVLGVYRSIQVGVAFIAPGIILGGIWADYSWGRFWGWDPKETWALIALLGYVAILHARLVGLIKDFGLLICGVCTFALVIMAWYGVNFVLGAGLHSYGFGAGGVEYVAGFVAIHLLFCVFVAVVRKQRK